MAYKSSINPPELHFQPPGIDFDHPDAAECLRVRLSAETESKTRLGLAFRASTRGDGAELEALDMYGFFRVRYIINGHFRNRLIGGTYHI